jgi:hypothetical protein
LFAVFRHSELFRRGGPSISPDKQIDGLARRVSKGHEHQIGTPVAQCGRIFHGVRCHRNLSRKSMVAKSA